MTTSLHPDHLLDRLRRSLDRDHALPATYKARKALRYGASAAVAPLYLLGCDRVGRGARARGRPVITNAGRIEIGERANLNSMFAPILLSTSPGGRIEIGDDAAINFGCSISAEARVKLGDRVSLGPYVTLADSDGGAGDLRGARPIVVGDDVWLAARVRVRKGAVIGDGAVITAGSEVVGEIPPGVVAGGVPARVLRRKAAGHVGPKELAPPAVAAERTAEADDRGLLVGDLRALRRLGTAASRGLAGLALHGVDHLGARARVHGLPFVENLGRITIGDDLELHAAPVRSHLVTGASGVLAIGDGVTIGAGAAIAAETRVEIGDGVHLGPLVMILDSDYHDAANRSAPGVAAPIVVGAHAWLGEGVTVLRGATIGRFARVEAGSVVSGIIPEGALAAGVPARVIHRGDATPAARVQRGSTSRVDVTVIVPTFHREREVVEAVESALHQTGVTVEVLVIDDSEEGSARGAIEGRSDARVRYQKRAVPSRGKPGLVRNDGIALARGRFIVFLDDDDKLADGALAALAGALERSPRAGVAVGTVIPFGDEEASVRHERAYFDRAARRLRARRTRFDMVACLLFKDAPLVNSACMIRRELARAIGGYDPRTKHCEDVELYSRAIRASGFAFVDQPVVHYRTDGTSRIHAMTNDRRQLEESYRAIHESYRGAYGWLELHLLKVLARAIR